MSAYRAHVTCVVRGEPGLAQTLSDTRAARAGLGAQRACHTLGRCRPETAGRTCLGGEEAETGGEKTWACPEAMAITDESGLIGKRPSPLPKTSTLHPSRPLLVVSLPLLIVQRISKVSLSILRRSLCFRSPHRHAPYSDIGLPRHRSSPLRLRLHRPD